MIAGLVHCRDGAVVWHSPGEGMVPVRRSLIARPARRRRRNAGLSLAVIKRVLKAGGRLELRPDGSIIITAADQTNNDQTNTDNAFDIEAEKLRRQKRGES
jgi:hypothetical protein